MLLPCGDRLVESLGAAAAAMMTKFSGVQLSGHVLISDNLSYTLFTVRASQITFIAQQHTSCIQVTVKGAALACVMSVDSFRVVDPQLGLLQYAYSFTARTQRLHGCLQQTVVEMQLYVDQ